MKCLASNLLWGLALIIAITVALGLIGYSILSSTDVKLDVAQETVRALWGRARPSPDTVSESKPDEVRSYTLFTEVDYGALEVTTGIRYASTTSPDIESQWCYIAANVGSGQSQNHLTLATKNPETGLVIPSFQNSALAQFSLTQTSVQDLIGSHCRFQ